MSRPRVKAALALLLLVPVPSFGVASALWWFPGSAGGAFLFTACKVWLLLFPLAWWRLVEGGALSFRMARVSGLTAGALSGLVISLVILGAFFLGGAQLVSRPHLAARLAAFGLDRLWRYAAGAAYWILVNSLLEEYVWRWFCTRQCEVIWSRPAAIALSAVFFALHHAVALSAYMTPGPVLLCSAGIAVGGALWSWLYLRYRTIWPGYVSHALVDLAVFAAGAWVLFS